MRILTLLAFMLALPAARAEGLSQRFGQPSPVSWLSTPRSAESRAVGNFQFTLSSIHLEPFDPDQLPEGVEHNPAWQKPEGFRFVTLSLTIRAGSGSDGFCLPVDVRRVLAPGGGSEPPVSPKLTYRLKNAGRDTPCSVSGTRYDEVNLVFVVPASEREFLFEAGLEDPREFRVTDKSSRLELAVLPNPPATDSLPAVPAAKSKRFSRRFQGRVGATPVFDFVLESDGTKLRGHYRYTRTGQLHWLEGELGLDGEYSLREFFPKGKLTGRLKGKSLMAATLRGYFTRPDGETPQSFEFEEIGAGPGAGAPLVPFDDPATVPTEGDPTAAE